MAVKLSTHKDRYAKKWEGLNKCPHCGHSCLGKYGLIYHIRKKHPEHGTWK